MAIPGTNFKYFVMRVCIILIFLIGHYYNYGQGQPKADNFTFKDCLEVIETSSDEGELIHCYIKIWNHYQYQNNDDSLNYFLTKGEEKFQKINSTKGVLTARNHRIRSLIWVENLDGAEQLARSSLEYAKENDPFHAHFIHWSLSLIYSKRVQYDSVFTNLFKVIRITKDKDNKSYFTGLTQIIESYIDVEDFNSIEFYIDEAMSYKNEVNLIYQYIFYELIIGYYGVYKKDYKMYAECLNELLKMQDKFDNPSYRYHSHSLLYNELPKEGQEEFLKRAIAANVEKNYISGRNLLMFNLVTFYKEQNNTKALADLFDEHYAIFDSIRLFPGVEILESFESAFSRPGYFEKAYQCGQFLRKIIKRTQSQMNESYSIEMEKKYQLELKEAEIQKAKLTRNSLYGIGTLLFLLSAFGFYSLKQKQRILRQEKAIQGKEIEQLKREQKIINMASVIEGQESERIRIAKDLHDGIGGLLSTVKVHIGTIQNEIQELENFNVFKKANEMMDHACEEIRRISHNLMPAVLRAQGLGSATQQIVNQLNDVHQIKTEFEIHGFENRIDESTEVLLYRIIQEITNNIVKHAAAKKAWIQIFEHPASIQILIEDNGIGFDLSKVKGNGLGLKSLESRVDFLKGSIEIDSRIQQGTSITINVPKNA